MSTLWTPSGERPIPRKDEPAPGGAPGGGAPGPGGRGSGAGSPGSGSGGDEPTEEQIRAEMAELQARLAHTPAEVVIANHAFGLFELAGLHLSLDPPQLDQARLAIDALAALVEGLGDRLGPPARDLSAGLSQMRMAFVQISGAQRGAGRGTEAGEADASSGGEKKGGTGEAGGSG
jgi:hypothetical protein